MTVCNETGLSELLWYSVKVEINDVDFTELLNDLVECSDPWSVGSSQYFTSEGMPDASPQSIGAYRGFIEENNQNAAWLQPPQIPVILMHHKNKWGNRDNI